ncbi:MAG: cytidylate kinase-like family protein [Lachnospiraceae bacterium]|nr:cytidylate kinase-like family protein [Lachnospiraceae bacterium]
MNTIVTIGRQFGSGGREIGEKLAQKMGVPYFDKELLARAAKESGFAEEMIQMHDERPTSSFLYSVVMDSYSFGYNQAFSEMPISQKVFLAQFDTVKKIAAEGACVIVGRCADYALSDFKNCLNVFIFGQEEAKAKRVSARHNVTVAEAKDLCRKTDKQRQSYYNYYSAKKWGRADSYHLCMDSGVLGIDGTVDFLYEYIKNLEARRNG